MWFKKNKKKEKQNQFTNNFKLVFCACMLGISTLFAFIGTFIKIPFFAQMSLDIDISIIFIIPIIFICSLKWALLSGFINAILHFAWNASNWIGILILLISNLLTILIFSFFKYIVEKNENIKPKKTKWIYIWFLSIIFLTLFLTILNGILFTPLYWWWISPGLFTNINFIETSKIYNENPNLHIYLLGIPNYWAGIFGLYSFFNLIKFVLISLFSIPILIFFQKYSMTSNLFN
ncbi:MPN527 family putative ECF transporter permease subunit [Mycoplasmoides pirum]|uniref:MPN527 family putative ECF transporter permease subunit n=1 Tax=Mycoplasmoides pirum TaxID=2122 RepID=UPI0004800344|nr:ECF transporter S component [Mycoplasmoides pirum]